MQAFDQISARPYEPERDWWRVRHLLVDTYPLTPPGFNWEIRRWDGQRYHRASLAPDPAWVAGVRLWETTGGQLVGAAHTEGQPGDVCLQLHPDYRFLMDDMLAWAEDTLSGPDSETGGRQLLHFAFDYDTPRQRVLAQRGYEQMPWFGMFRCLRFGAWPIPAANMAEGYTLRTVRVNDEADYTQVAALLNAAFNRTVHSAREYRNFTAHSPSYRPDPDWVAEAADGTLAALVGVAYEPNCRYGVFEPVCTHPMHQRHGLARALMLEGMHRLRALGALTAHVDTGDREPANALYDAMGFSEAYRGHYWRKRLP
jgi:GNAT superfamily N-acetyltransferase